MTEQCTSTWLPRVNAYGLRKAEKFRRRFGLTTENIDRDYIDSHDYLHTVLGKLPVYEDEMAVLELEEKVRNGLILKGFENQDSNPLRNSQLLPSIAGHDPGNLPRDRVTVRWFDSTRLRPLPLYNTGDGRR